MTDAQIIAMIDREKALYKAAEEHLNHSWGEMQHVGKYLSRLASELTVEISKAHP